MGTNTDVSSLNLLRQRQECKQKGRGWVAGSTTSLCSSGLGTAQPAHFALIARHAAATIGVVSANALTGTIL